MHVRATWRQTPTGPEWEACIVGPERNIHFGTREPTLSIDGAAACDLIVDGEESRPFFGQYEVSRRLAAKWGYVLGEGSASGDRQSWRWEIHKALHEADLAEVDVIRRNEGVPDALYSPVLIDWVDAPGTSHCTCKHCLALASI